MAAAAILAACIVCGTQSSAVAQSLSGGKAAQVVGATVVPLGENASWLWGMESGQFFLARTQDQGHAWMRCQLPAELTRFVQNERLLSRGNERSFLAGTPISAAFPDASNAWITWLVHKGEFAVDVFTAHTADQCRTWSVVSASEPGPIGQEQADLESQHLNTQFVGRNGWAFVYDSPDTSMCLQALMATSDGGHSWHWLPEPLSDQCPDSNWRFYSPAVGWLAHANPYAENNFSRIFSKTTDGGQTWTNVSAKIDLPSGIPTVRPTDRSNSDADEITPPAFSATNRGAGTLAIVYRLGMDGQDQYKLAIYRTTDAGQSWKLAKVQPDSADLIRSVAFQDDLHGFACIGPDLAYTRDGGLTWSRHKIPEGIEDTSTFALRGNVLWAIKSAKGQSSILISTDGGATWQERAIRVK